jgi:predicted SnoaL-like aldol condensation-catalyzing enzyme
MNKKTAIQLIENIIQNNRNDRDISELIFDEVIMNYYAFVNNKKIAIQLIENILQNNRNDRDISELIFDEVVINKKFVS